ncbi:Hypothetical protein NTJ_03956 [Nesidiocoris tenuis]|uniref:Uncharacterized protein n=1 Tax=Nesidiocoris tenuis TaxID=355587 RepID=A0ABN7ALB3_9HEMI|nr:Hypothetical protein NTJ_03956 [Nesidiocoris tenuis]
MVVLLPTMRHGQPFFSPQIVVPSIMSFHPPWLDCRRCLPASILSSRSPRVTPAMVWPCPSALQQPQLTFGSESHNKRLCTSKELLTTMDVLLLFSCFLAPVLPSAEGRRPPLGHPRLKASSPSVSNCAEEPKASKVLDQKTVQRMKLPRRWNKKTFSEPPPHSVRFSHMPPGRNTCAHTYTSAIVTTVLLPLSRGGRSSLPNNKPTAGFPNHFKSQSSEDLSVVPNSSTPICLE